VTPDAYRPAWRIAVQAGATVLGPGPDEVISFDLEGRPRSWFRHGQTFKRSLASDVVGRQTVEGVRRRWRLREDEADTLFRRAAEVADAATGRLGDVPEGRREELRARLERALAWDPQRLRSERARFDAAYAPITILPPDQYGAIVLQATFGCSWNRCTFCSFYQDRPFQVRAPEAFASHLEAVRDLLGRDAAARQGVFLADGNALVLGQARLRPIVEAAATAFPGRALAGFVDVFGGEHKPLGDWRALRALGLRRVAVGVETGHDALLEALNKPGGAEAAAAFVTTLKAAGLGVSVILMVGVGGRRFAGAHVHDTTALLARLPLAQGDLVYLSPFVEHTGSAYAERAQAEAWIGLSEAERASQAAALRQAARATVPAAQVAAYPIDEFVY